MVGMEPSTIKAISEAASKSLVVVRYASSACELELKVLEGCKSSARYAYELKADTRRDIIRDQKALVRSLPLGAQRLQPALKEHGSLRIVEQVVGTLKGPPGIRIGRNSLRGRSCDDATHVALVIQVGASTVLSGPSQKRLRIEEIGKPKVCKKALHARKQTDGCDRPLRMELIPIVEGGAKARSMISISKGSFEMGSDTYKRGDGPAHRVLLDAYEIDPLEVTAGEYLACEATKACSPAKRGPMCTAGVLGKERHPINCVTWSQANTYCKFVGKKLPTEAQWARAARGKKRARFAWGDAWPPPQGSGNFADGSAARQKPHWEQIEGYQDGFAYTAPVDAFEGAASPEGALNMGGNVMEWVADYYSDRLFAMRARKRKPTENPTGGNRSNERVVRGASFGTAKKVRLEITHRSPYRANVASMHIGFRCAR